MAYKQRIAKYYNVRIKSKSFQKDDLILRQVEVLKHTKQGKLALDQDGPYRITHVIRSRAYRIENLDGSIILLLEILKILKNIMNENALTSSFLYIVFSHLSRFDPQTDEVPRGMNGDKIS